MYEYLYQDVGICTYIAVERVNNINKAFTRSERLLVNIIISVNTIGVVFLVFTGY